MARLPTRPSEAELPSQESHNTMNIILKALRPKYECLCHNCVIACLISGPRLQLGEGNGTPLQYSCLENPMDRGAWKAAVHGIAEGRTRLNDFTFTFHSRALEKEMATHSSVLAWRIPGTGEPGGLWGLWGHTELDTTEVTQQQQQQTLATLEESLQTNLIFKWHFLGSFRQQSHMSQ